MQIEHYIHSTGAIVRRERAVDAFKGMVNTLESETRDMYVLCGSRIVITMICPESKIADGALEYA